MVPVDNEEGLRNLSWIESNRRKVDQMTGGKVAYVYVPDTAVDGYTNFNRYFFAQVGKEAAIIDERFNHGGFLADFIVDYLRRPLLNKVMTREGKDHSEPAGAIYGPKVMIVNQFAGSGGDALPWYFRKLGIGPIVGERTWGGLIGIGGYPPLLDGGYVMAPRWAIYGLQGRMGSRKPRRRARHRSHDGPQTGARRPRSATREGSRDGDGVAQAASPAGIPKARVSRLPSGDAAAALRERPAA